MADVRIEPEELDRLLALDRKFAKEGLTFDDVLLVPAESNVLPNEVSTRTRLTPRIELSIPIVSAAMDTVTEAPLAIAMARHGGIGVVNGVSEMHVENSGREQRFTVRYLAVYAQAGGGWRMIAWQSTRVPDA